MAEPKAPNEQALAAFMACKAEIDALLGDMQAWSDEHFGIAPEDVTWNHVAELEEWLRLLGRAVGFSRAPRRPH